MLRLSREEIKSVERSILMNEEPLMANGKDKDEEAAVGWGGYLGSLLGGGGGGQ